MKLRTATKSFSSSKLWMCIALASVFTAGTVQAFTDVPHTIATKLGHGATFAQLTKQIAEAKKQLTEAQNTYANLQKNLIAVQGLKSSGLEMTDKFEERPADYGMDVACPGAGAFSLTNLMSSLAINMEGDIKKQQKEICQRIVLARNAQYNEAAKMLRHLRTEQGAKLKAIEAERQKVGDSAGRLQGVQEMLEQYQADSNRDQQYSATLIAAYGTYIETLQQSQSMLGKQALTGNNGSETFADTVTRKFVQGAVLKTALETVSDRDR
ncbi:MAG: hypothetical protein ACREPB_08745 [Arenimonas sp.]